MLYDYHLHTHFSGDCDCSAEYMIQAAIKKQISEICITDHMDYDYPNDPDFFLFSPEKYFPALTALQREYRSKINIKLGIELGLQPQVAKENKKTVTQYPWDFVIGSLHIVDYMDPYYPEYWENFGLERGISRYFESILESIKAFDDFDVYGHLDYIIRYCNVPYTKNVYFEFHDLIDECLKAILSAGKGIELNTGGFSYGLGHPNPCEDILKRYRELGGEIITIGSDAHKPETLAFSFQRAAQILMDCGFSYFTSFSKRIPTFIKLEALHK